MRGAVVVALAVFFGLVTVVALVVFQVSDWEGQFASDPGPGENWTPPISLLVAVPASISAVILWWVVFRSQGDLDS